MNWNEDEVAVPRFGDDITYWWDLDGSDLDFEEEEIEEWESEPEPDVDTPLDFEMDENFGRPTW